MTQYSFEAFNTYKVKSVELSNSLNELDPSDPSYLSVNADYDQLKSDMETLRDYIDPDFEYEVSCDDHVVTLGHLKDAGIWKCNSMHISERVSKAEKLHLSCFAYDHSIRCDDEISSSDEAPTSPESARVNAYETKQLLAIEKAITEVRQLQSVTHEMLGTMTEKYDQIVETLMCLKRDIHGSAGDVVNEEEIQRLMAIEKAITQLHEKMLGTITKNDDVSVEILKTLKTMKRDIECSDVVKRMNESYNVFTTQARSNGKLI